MWSQYSNGHKGFVIEFKPDFNLFESMKSKSGQAYPVKIVDYVEDYRILFEDIADEKGIIEVQTLLNELFYKKTSHWKYENEYRMVRPLSDCPQYEPPGTNYAYTDTNTYLFPFEVDCINSIILGASMTQENKSKLLEFSDKHNIALFQAHVIRDMKDKFGEPGSIIILPVENDNRKAILNANPQLFCTDTVCLENSECRLEVKSLRDLPYYKDHESIVEEFYKNLQSSSRP
jgi:hypothetical protein